MVSDLSAWEFPWKRSLWKGPERFWYLAMKTSSLAVATPACLSEPCLSYRTKIMSLTFPSLEIRPFGKQLNGSILGNLYNTECLWVSFQRKWGIIAHSDQFPLLLLFSLSPQSPSFLSWNQTSKTDLRRLLLTGGRHYSESSQDPEYMVFVDVWKCSSEMFLLMRMLCAENIKKKANNNKKDPCPKDKNNSSKSIRGRWLKVLKSSHTTPIV